jgi:hypothetical protein
MMCVGSTPAAKVVPSRHRVELIHPQGLRSSNDGDSGQGHRRDYCAPSPTQRAVASARIDDAIGQVEFKFDVATVTRCPVSGLNRGVTDSCDRHGVYPVEDR